MLVQGLPAYEYCGLAASLGTCREDRIPWSLGGLTLFFSSDSIFHLFVMSNQTAYPEVRYVRMEKSLLALLQLPPSAESWFVQPSINTSTHTCTGGFGFSKQAHIFSLLIVSHPCQG